jgi:hypothetical protein
MKLVTAAHQFSGVREAMRYAEAAILVDGRQTCARSTIAELTGSVMHESPSIA